MLNIVNIWHSCAHQEIYGVFRESKCKCWCRWSARIKIRDSHQHIKKNCVSCLTIKTEKILDKKMALMPARARARARISATLAIFICTRTPEQHICNLQFAISNLHERLHQRIFPRIFRLFFFVPNFSVCFFFSRHLRYWCRT